MPQTAPLRTVQVGSFFITYLPDGGGVVVPTALFPASAEGGWDDRQELLDDDGKLITTIGGFLIETPNRKMIVDTGIGPVSIDFPGFGPFSGGRYLDSFAQTGVDRQEIDTVIFTHLHLDHVGWTSIEEDGQRVLTFPNAKHLATQIEWETWVGGDNPAGPHPETVQKPLDGYLTFIQGGDEIAPGITVLETPGHTPGHISLKIKSEEQTLYLVADVIHNVAQFEEMDWFVAFDMDPETARQSREGLYDALAQPNTLVACNHFADEIFGRLTNEDGRWVWHPLT